MILTFVLSLDCLIDSLIHYSAFSAALDRNPGLGYNTGTLLLLLIPGDLYSGCLHRQFHPFTESCCTAKLLRVYPDVCVPSREAV